VRSQQQSSPTAFRRLFRTVIHRLSYHFIYEPKRTRTTRAAGFSMTVPPTVFHPRWFLTSEFFASFIGSLDLAGKRVADVGTGSGILALAAARAGAAKVVGLDINPNAAFAVGENARLNGLADKVEGLCSDLLSAVPPGMVFDVILSSPPSFPGEPLDLADRAWHAGPEYRDIANLFEQTSQRLAPGGKMYLLLSSDSDLALLHAMSARAGFQAKQVAERSIFLESFPLYELSKSPAPVQAEAPVAPAANAFVPVSGQAQTV
jgi:methylase of polypeptide subunit release factors